MLRLVVSDPDPLIARIRVIYAAARGVYAVAYLLTTVPYAIAHTGTASQLALIAAPTMPLRRGAVIVIAFWLTGATPEVLLRGGPATWMNIGLGTGSILGVQLFALIFVGLMRGALRHVHADVEARKKLIVSTRVAHSVAEQCHVTTNVTPRLKSKGGLCGLMFRAVILASPTNRGLLGGAPAVYGVLRADISTAESCSIAIQFKFNSHRPVSWHQY